MRRLLVILHLIAVGGSLEAGAAVYLNSGNNNIDVVWRISSYPISENITTVFPLADSTPVFISDERESVSFNGSYSEIKIGAVANFTPDNQLDSLLIATAINSNVSIFTDVSVYFNLTVGSDTVMRTYFVPGGASGVAGTLYLGPLVYQIDDPLLASDGVVLEGSVSGPTDYRTVFNAYMPAGEGGISGSIVITFDREINGEDIQALSTIPEPSYAFAVVGTTVLSLLRRRRG